MDQLRLTGVFEAWRLTAPVTIIGVGALGSAVALNLAKIGVHLHLIDDDKVESHNLPNQVLYGLQDIGLHKVHAAREALFRLTGNTPEASIMRVGDRPLRSRYIISCVDSMKSRREILDCLTYDAHGFYMDGRMGARDGSSFLVPRKVENMRCYEKSLFSDNDAFVERAACGTVQSVGATAMAIASAMTWQFINFVMEREPPAQVHLSFSPFFMQEFKDL